MNLKVFVWNAQVFGDHNFIRVTREYLQDHHHDICVFVEPRVSHFKADRIIAALAFPNSFRVEANGFSGGIWLCWFDHVIIDILSCHFQFIHCRISDGFDSFLTTFVYASPQSRQRNELWVHLRALASSMTEPWSVIGDFNATLLHQDRQGCSSASPDSAFQHMVFDCDLHDLDYFGPAYTWYRGNYSVRLDRCFGNSAWFEKFSASALHV
ncbi:hypothetical protein V6N13_029701 [Hibiscus sabdariffa]